MSTTTKQSKRPTHGIFQVKGDGDNAFWHRVGAAWMHKDKKGASLIFDSLPLSGRVEIRELNDKDTQASQGNQGGAQ